MKKIYILSFLFIFLIITALFSETTDNKFINANDIFRKGNISKALQQYKEITSETSDIELINKSKFKIAVCYYYLKDYTKCIEMLDKVISLKTNISIKDKAIRFKGDVYYFKKQYKTAIDTYKRIIESHTTSKELFTAKLQTARCYMKLNEKDKAMDLLLKMQDEYKDSKYIKQIEFYLKRVKK